MKEDLKPLVQSLLMLEPDDRVAVIQAVFGVGVLPELEKDERVTYRLQGVEVDQGTYELVSQTTGIFKPEQFDSGLSQEQALDVLEAAQRARYAGTNAEWYLREADQHVSTLRQVGQLLGLSLFSWQVPTLAQLTQALGDLVADEADAEPPPPEIPDP